MKIVSLYLNETELCKQYEDSYNETYAILYHLFTLMVCLSLYSSDNQRVSYFHEFLSLVNSTMTECEFLTCHSVITIDYLFSMDDIPSNFI